MDSSSSQLDKSWRRKAPVHVEQGPSPQQTAGVTAEREPGVPGPPPKRPLAASELDLHGPPTPPDEPEPPFSPVGLPEMSKFVYAGSSSAGPKPPARPWLLTGPAPPPIPTSPSLAGATTTPHIQVLQPFVQPEASAVDSSRQQQGQALKIAEVLQKSFEKVGVRPASLPEVVTLTTPKPPTSPKMLAPGRPLEQAGIDILTPSRQLPQTIHVKGSPPPPCSPPPVSAAVIDAIVKTNLAALQAIGEVRPKSELESAPPPPQSPSSLAQDSTAAREPAVPGGGAFPSVQYMVPKM